MAGFEGQNFRRHEGGKYLCLFTSRRKSSTVSDPFGAIPILQLSQHCTGWQSASRVHIQCDSVLYLEYHHSWGHSGYLGVQRPLLVPPQTRLCQGKVRVRLGLRHHCKRELTLLVALTGVWLPPGILGSRLSLPVPDDVDGFDPPGSRELDHTLSHTTVGSVLNDTVPYR